MGIWQRIRFKTFPVSSRSQSAHVDVKIMLEKVSMLKYFVETDLCECEASCSARGNVKLRNLQRAKCWQKSEIVKIFSILGTLGIIVTSFASILGGLKTKICKLLQKKLCFRSQLVMK